MAFRISSVLHKRRFTLLLITLLLMTLATPVAHAFGMAPRLAGTATALLFALMLLAAMHAAAASRRLWLVSLALLIPLVVLHVANSFFESSKLDMADDALSVIFLAYLIVASLRTLFRAEVVTLETISTSLCVYLLVGVLWATSYSLVDHLQPGSFSHLGVESHLSEHPELSLYYSFVTLTTLGYGDILPLTPLARALAFTEAIVGQVYLTVLVARLVGLHIAGSR